MYIENIMQYLTLATYKITRYILSKLVHTYRTNTGQHKCAIHACINNGLSETRVRCKYPNLVLCSQYFNVYIFPLVIYLLTCPVIPKIYYSTVL